MANLLFRLGYVRKGHLVTVTRDDLVGQYIGHTAPKTKEVLKKAMGGVLFIDEAYYLYRPENERDYGQEAIEILLQVMENNRDDLVVILAGYKDKMDKFFESICDDQMEFVQYEKFNRLCHLFFFIPGNVYKQKNDSENLYLDYHYGKEAASEYVIGTRSSISNRSPGRSTPSQKLFVPNNIPFDCWCIPLMIDGLEAPRT